MNLLSRALARGKATINRPADPDRLAADAIGEARHAD
jgi:hypothetical protein